MLDETEVVEVIGPAVPRTFQELNDPKPNGAAGDSEPA
jgi:hypothetical protein